MYEAAERSKQIAFNQLHEPCKGRVTQKRWCAACQVEVPNDKIVRGYEFEKDKYITVADAEVESVEEASNGILEVVAVSEDTVNPLFIDTTTYLVPDGPAHVPSFDTIRAALGTRLAVGHLVHKKRTVQVALQADPNGFVAYVLRGTEQVRSLKDLNPLAGTVTVNPAEVALAAQLLTAMAGPLEYPDLRDEYTVRMQAMLDAKVNGTAAPMPVAAKAPTSSLADALKASLATAKAKPAKATLEDAKPKAKKKSA
jgi:DNA end-binding protein Ku